ncbi:MAG: DUF1428 domain-containing protein [Myxococcales bacterium]|nr:DUF1428 domain-containing protein [Myxococcales bacterium]
MTYVDGYVCAVPTARFDEYKQMAEASAEIFKEYGAIRVVEAWGDDVPNGEVTSFPMAVKKEEHETVVLSWIVWPSKAHRNQMMPKAMEDTRFQGLMKSMPFDGKRLIYGSFRTILDV